MAERIRPKINNGLGMHSLPSTSTTMALSRPEVAASTPIPESKVHVTLLSASSMAPSTPISEMRSSTSTIITPSTPSMTPSTPIPEIYESIHATSTLEERMSFLDWVRSTARMAASDESDRLFEWAYYRADIADVPAPDDWAHSSSTMATPDERKRRFLKWAHSTSTMAAPDERKRWSLQEEISKPFATALKRIQEEIKKYETALRKGYAEDDDSCTELKQEHMIYSCHKGMHGVYQCQNALWIWSKLRNSRAITYAITLSQLDGGPGDVGKKIKEKFPESDMIEGRPSINDLGFVTIKLSGKWIAKSIHKMLKDGNGIDTWAPKLPLERVIVDCPSLDEEMHVDLFRRRAIRYTLMSILEYSKVDVTIGHNTILTTRSKRHRAQKILNRWFSNEEKDQRDFDNAYKDLLALWYGRQRADWIIYLTPAWNQDYIEMCFTASKLEKCATSNGHKPARTSYAGYRTCTIELEDNLLDKAKISVAVEQGEDAKLLGYTPEAVLDCVFTYAYLKKHRLAECKFNINDETMLKEEGNTFVYLLYTQAKIRRVTDDYCEDINELKKASELILEKDEGWEEGEERTLGFHLLEFTEVLEESCLSVLPHILCEYLYDLAKKFNSYYSSVCKVGFVAETSTLLLCEATAVVMEKSFHLLGITPTCSSFELSVTPLSLRSPFSAVKRPMDVNSRDRPRNSRFELLSFCSVTVTTYETPNENGGLFGLISVSDKYGLPSDGGSHFFEPDFAHVPLFNREWYNPINLTDSGLVYFGHPSVSFSSSVEIRMELYVNKNKNACYQLCNHKIEIDLSDFWDKTSDSACGALSVEGEDGSTHLYYILLKDAIDAALEMKFVTKTPGREVRGYVFAYYGDDFLYECQCLPSFKYNYMSLLFGPNHVLEAGKIQLIKSMLAVPTKGMLVIEAYLEDAKSGKVIMKNSCKFKSKLSECSVGTISGIAGEDCCLDLKVDWKYQA